MLSSNSQTRRSVRLVEYDYSQAGAYFITICSRNHEYVFGNIVNGKMMLNKEGEIVKEEWDKLPEHYLSVEIDEFVIMPNHVHGIIQIVGAQFIAPNNDELDKGVINRAPTLGEIVRGFKARVSYRINSYHNTPGTSIWQRNYYEHVIRNEKELHAYRLYIRHNPLKLNGISMS